MSDPVRPAVPDRARHDGRFAWALLLLALAGAVDATGFLVLRGLFVSFMSGNTTQAAVALASSDLRGGVAIGVVIASFVAGVVAGDLAAGEPPRRAGAVLLAEAIVVLLAWRQLPLAGPFLAFAMGMHNALVLRAERIGLALTYVTGTLVHLGRAVAARIAGRDHVSPSWPYLAMWIALMAGGVAGACGFHAIGADIFIVLAALLGLAGVGAFVWQGRRR